MAQIRTRRILLIVLAAVILLPVLAVLALVATFDPDIAKPRIVAAVEAATGRKLAINGPIRLVVGLHPSIELTDATLSNPAGFSRPAMAILKQLNLQLALLPLLQRQIEIDRLAVRGADILLELNAAGEGNWQFRPAAEPGPASPPQPQATPAAKAHPPTIHIDKIEIADGQIAYRNPRMAMPEAVVIKSLTLVSGTADEQVHVSMAASADAVPFTLDGQIGPYGALFGGAAQPVRLDFQLAAAGAKIALVGNVADPARLSGTDIRVNADIPDLAALPGLAQAGLPPLKGIAVQTRITDLAGKPGLLTGFALHDLKLAAPQLQLDGDIAVTRGSPPLLQGSLHMARLDASALRSVHRTAPTPAAAGVPAPPVPPPPSRSAPKRLIPDQELPLDLLRAVDADLTITIGELVQDRLTLRDLAGKIALHKAALHLAPLTATIPGGAVRLNLSIDAAKPATPVALTLSAPSLALGPLLAAFALPAYAQGNLRVDADLHGTGRSAHQIAATLDGSVGLSMENAQIDSRVLGDALKGLDLLKNGQSGFTALRCLAARMDARNGAGTLRALLLDTVPARLSGSGGLNLGEETLDVRLQTTIRVGPTGISAPLDIRGTFLSPQVKVDTAMPVSGGIPGAGANAPFGIVIGKLGLDQLLSGGTGNSCAHDLAIARGETPPQEPAAQPPAQQPSPSPFQLAPSQPGAKPPKPADLLRQLLR